MWGARGRGALIACLILLSHGIHAVKVVESLADMKEAQQVEVTDQTAVANTEETNMAAEHKDHALAQTGHNSKAQTEQVELRIDPKLVGWGRSLAIRLAIPLLLFFLVGIHLTFTVYRYDEKQERPEPMVGRVIALGGIGVSLALIFFFYFKHSRPKECPPGETCNSHAFYYRSHVFSLIVTAVILLVTAGIMTTTTKPSRATALIGHFFAQFTLVVGLLVQAWLGAMLGEWSFNEAAPDATISSSMDYVPGTILSTAVLAPMAALIPLFESLFIDTGETFQRGLRVALSAFAAVGVLAVVMTPLETQGVSKETSDSWHAWHTRVAAGAFGFLAFYLIAVGVTSMMVNGSSFFVIFGLVILVLGVVLLLVNFAQGTNRQRQLFAIGEYLCIFAVPILGMSRFHKDDFQAIQVAIRKSIDG